jgi:aminoglycoside 3-N-acetyltransferase I
MVCDNLRYSLSLRLDIRLYLRQCRLNLNNSDMDVTIRKLNATDYALLTELLSVYKEAFELTNQTWPEGPYLRQILDNPAITFMAAIHQQRVVGGLTAYTLPSVYRPASELYLYDLAVLPRCQRDGVGTSLLRQLIEDCRGKGIKEIFVQADIPDEHAIRFYRKNGGISEDVIHFSFPIQSHL